MDRVLLEGKEYTKISTAAKDTGYTADYIGQLCRAGKIDAKLVGRSWYVNEMEIQEHRKGKTRSNSEKTITTVREALKAETIRSQATGGHTLPEYKKRLLSGSISYETDQQNLMPEPVRSPRTEVEEEVVIEAVPEVLEEEVPPEEETAIPILRVSEKEVEPAAREQEDQEIAPEPPVEPMTFARAVTRRQPVLYVSKFPMVVSLFLALVLAGGFLFVQSKLTFEQELAGTEPQFNSTYSLSSVSTVIEAISALK